MFLHPTNIVKFFSAAALLLGAAVFVFWFLFGRSLEKDIHRMINTMAEVTSLHAKVQFSSDSLDDLPIVWRPEQSNVRLGIDGDFNLNEKDDPDYAVTFKYKSSGSDSSAAGDITNLGDWYYFRVTEIPDYGGVDFSSFENKWIDIPVDFSVAEFLGSESLEDLSEENLVDLQELLNQIELVNVVDTGIVEIIDHDSSIPYSFVINPEGMTIFLATIWEMRHAREIDLLSFRTIEASVEKMIDWKGTAWIGKRSFLLHRLKIEAPNFILTVQLSDFNKPVSIEKPSSNPINIESALKQLGLSSATLPDLGSSSYQYSDSVSINDEIENNDPDQDGLDNSLERFYLTDPNNPDTDGDGVLDGEEVQAGKNPNGEGSLFSFGLPF